MGTLVGNRVTLAGRHVGGTLQVNHVARAAGAFVELVDADDLRLSQMLDRISVVIIARNAARTLERTIDSVAVFDEVVVYLNDSTDDTEALARKFRNVRVVKGPFLGFGPTKNRAIDAARNEWILSLDSDEILTPQLRNSIAEADLTDPSVVYRVRRHNYFLGARMRFGDFGPEQKVRLFNRDVHRFEDADVHESVAVRPNAPVRTLEGSLEHVWIYEPRQLTAKLDRYSNLQGRRRGRALSPAIFALRSLWAFFRCYVIRLGLLDGWRGFAVAVWVADNVFYKYLMSFDRARKE